MSTIKTSLIALAITASPLALADHNSPFGDGWANMPNDIHNTRIETRDDDNQVFIDFVRGGNGADSVNDEEQIERTTGGMGMGGGKGGRS